MNTIKCIVLAFLCLSICGCAMVSRQPLTQQGRKQIGSDQLVVSTNQREIKPNLGLIDYQYTTPPYESEPVSAADPASLGLLDGLIVGMIDDHRIHTLEKQSEPIRAALTNYSFMPVLKKELSQQLDKISWLKLKKSELKQDFLTDQQKSALLQKSKGRTALFIDVNYLMNRHLSALFVSAHVELSKMQANGQALALYQNYFVYIDRLPQNITDRNAAVSLWTANHGERLKSALKQAAKDFSYMITMDIKNPKKDTYENLKKPVIKFFNHQDALTYGKVIGKLGGQMIVRTSDGSLYFINKNSLIINDY